MPKHYFRRAWRQMGIGLILLRTTILATNVAYAEIKYISLWSGITGTGHTWGQSGQCGGIGGTASSLTSATANVYYLQTYSKLYSTAGGVHLLNYSVKPAFNTYATAQAAVPWPDCPYNYQTTRHAWQSASGTSGIKKNSFTSATGLTSSATCWNGSLC